MPVTIGGSRWRLRLGRGWLLRGESSCFVCLFWGGGRLGKGRGGERERGEEGRGERDRDQGADAETDGTRVSSICASATSGS